METTPSWNRRVLIVDDQEEIHSDFEEMLTRGLAKATTDALAAAFVPENDNTFLPEFRLFHAMSGEEACAVVEMAKDSGCPFAAAYIDIRMPPGIDGIETIQQIRKIEQDLEIVIMTAYTDKPLPEIVHDMALLHKLLYIRKPFAREEIQQITLSLVEKWNVEQQLAGKQRQLAISHQRLEAVLDATGDAIGLFDVSDRLLFANRAYEKLFEATESQLQAKPTDDLKAWTQARFREPVPSEWNSRVLAGAAGSVVQEVTAADDSSPRLFYRSSAPVQDGQGVPIGRIVVYRDLSKEVEGEQMKTEVLRLRSELKTTYAFAGMVGTSKRMQEVYALMQRAAESDITVLIQGESGTGKELVAKSIHYNSPRKAGPFVAVNCAAIPEALIESELFGHERGAFTGAGGRRIGQFERAQGGTLFLDEIGDMPVALQAKLLRVLQERELQRVGGAATIPVDIRVIAATHRDLERDAETGAFRVDLYYRLAAFPVTLPPLRDHREDIPLLALHFLSKQAERLHKPVRGLSPTALQQLLAYDWPGNVRELENAMARASLLETTDRVQAGSLPPQLLAPMASPSPATDAAQAVLPLVEVERQALVRALDASGGNLTRAAQALQVNRATLYRKLKKYRLLTGK